MRTQYRSRNILDGCRFSSSKRSAELNRAKPRAQGMKSTDPLLNAWQQTLRRAEDRPAIVSTRGEILRKFADVEERACAFESNLMFSPGAVIAVQIGNHEDWPSILIACLRRGLVVLPLEQSISDQQRDAALKTCKVSGIAAADVSAGRNIEIVPMSISAATTTCGEN